MTDFIFVRHGQSQANAEGTIASAKTPLTAEGRKQARLTALRLEKMGISTIVCSPMVRAHETAQIIADSLQIEGNDVVIIEELRERGLGDQEGKPKIFPTAYYYQEDPTTFEPRQALLDRMKLALERIKSLNVNGRILVVGHATSGFFLIEAAKGAQILEDFGGDYQINNADFVEVKLQ